MRAVTSATAAAALGVDKKLFGNMIGRLDASELPRGRQGLERRIPVSMLPRLLLAAEISDRLALPFRAAYHLTAAIARGEQPAAPFLFLKADFDLLGAEVDRRVESAIETVVRRARGRPRKLPAR